MARHANTILPTNAQDRTGLQVGALTVVGFAGIRDGRITWTCFCKCGKFCVVEDVALSKQTRMKCSRFCKIVDINICRINRNEYCSYSSMMNRCYNKKSDKYHEYGGRGITVSSRWRDGDSHLSGFKCFLLDMGKKPTKKHSLDRMDVNKPYETGNCRWTTNDVQQNNKRNSVKVTVNGVTKNLSEWARFSGIPEKTIRARYRNGWDHRDMVSRPVKKKLTKIAY